MNLLLVTGRFPERSETFIYRKAVALAKHGHQVTVAARRIGDWSLFPDALVETMRVEQLPSDDGLRDPRRLLSAGAHATSRAATHPQAARSLQRLCQRGGPGAKEVARRFLRHLPLVGRSVDLAHFEFLGLGTMYPLASEVLGAPVILSCRGQDVHMLEVRPPEERKALVAALLRADALHCVSDEMARAVARITGRTEGVWVNRPAVDTDRIRTRPPQTAGGPLRIVASGRLTWVKGFDHLLAALATLARSGVAFQAEIIGDGELHHALRFSIEDLELTRHVRLVGPLSSADVLLRLQTADVFVLSSLEEGLSNAVLEAMASGVPIVTTNAGGMAEAVTDGVEGFVVPIRTPAAIATRLEQLSMDVELRRRMGAAARERARSEFSLERQVATFETMYRSVIERGAR